MKAARVLLALGLMLTALNIVAFIGLERRSRALEVSAEQLASALDTARNGEILQEGPPPKGLRVIGISKPDYGEDAVQDECAAIGTWDGESFTHTYIEDGQAVTYALSHDPPEKWFPYP